MIGHITYRREAVFFPTENTLLAGKGGMGVHSAGKVCYLVSTTALFNWKFNLKLRIKRLCAYTL